MTDEGAERLSDDAALRAIVEGVEAETGEGFFQSLVEHLARALGVRYAFVSEFTEDRAHFRTRAVWGRGRLLDNFTIPIRGTPCEAVLGGTMSHHPSGLRRLFPHDAGLEAWGAESYCGVPLLDSRGEVVGHLAIMDGRPMSDGPLGLSILRIFAARARAEIERQRIETALRASEERLARIVDSAMDAIVTVDEAGRIEIFNEAAENVFGCPASAAIGAPLERFLTPGFRAALEASMRELAERRRRSPYVWSPEGLRALRADGAEFAVEATLSGVTAAGERLFTLILRDVEERRRSEAELRGLVLDRQYLEEEIKSVYNFDEIIGQSTAMGAVLDGVGRVAGTDSSVLILGETGTGKELIARAVHSNSRRRERPLIKVNCAALPTGLIESELFGHEKGAFTGATEKRLGRFELADGGTIFLDEVGELPPETQVKLLRVLQEQELERVGGARTIRVDVRVIAATNRDLDRAVADGSFRSDLYFRLNVFPVKLPPLRERREDISPLAHYFVARYAAKTGRKVLHVPPESMARLVSYAWPGNVRELENVIERAVILSRGPDLEIPPGVLRPGVRPAPAPSGARAPEGGLTLEEVERRHILSVLEQTNWRVEGPSGAARLLQLRPSTLRSRMERLGIRRSRAVGVTTPS